MSIRLNRLTLLAAFVLAAVCGAVFAGEAAPAKPQPPPAGEAPTPPEAAKPAGEGLVGPPVKLLPDQDVVFLHDGTEIGGTVVFCGQEAVILLTDEGERTVERKDVLRIQYKRASQPGKSYKTKVEEGHVYLTNEEAPEEAAPKRPAAQAKTPRPAAAQKPPAQPEPNEKPKPGMGRRPEMLRKALDALKAKPEMLEQAVKHLKEGDVPPDVEKMLDEYLKDMRDEK